MSQSAADSRLTNSNNSVNSATAGISGADESREIPTPEDRIAEFFEQYPERATIPVSRQDGQSIRADYAIDRDTEWQAKPATEREAEIGDVPAGTQTTARDAVRWIDAVETTLEKFEEARRTTVNLKRGRPSDPEYAEFSVESENRWFASYQKRYFGELNGWLRELTGGERPSGGETDAAFDDPYVVLLTRSASAVPEGEYMGPVDHADAIRSAWEPVYHELRNELRRKGYELGEDWQYERRMEPHKGERGGGTNWCYTHEHAVIVVDGEVEAGDFESVLQKHVDECEPASADAHAPGEAAEVFEAGEMDNLAAYVGSYCGIEPTELLERESEYIAWAAAMDAGNIRTKSRSDAAAHAATADACRQRSESAQSDQEKGHGERVVRSSKRGYEFECSCCGSPHAVDQDHDTLASARLADTAHPVADGGRDFEEEREEGLRDRWQDARAAAAVGETPTRRKRRKRIERELRRDSDATPMQIVARAELPPGCMELVEEVRAGYDRSGAAGFERPPEWRVESVTVGEEEYPASAGNGVQMVELDRSDMQRGDLGTFEGRETPAGEIEMVSRRFVANGEGTVECEVSGATISRSRPHLLVQVDGAELVVDDIPTLGAWCV